MTSHSESPSDHLGKRLEDILNDKKLSKAVFAEKIGVKPQQVSRWCQSSSFQWHLVKRFSEALEISESEFLGLS